MGTATSSTSSGSLSKPCIELHQPHCCISRGPFQRFPTVSNVTNKPFERFPRVSNVTNGPFERFPTVSNVTNRPFERFPRVSNVRNGPFERFPTVSNVTNGPFGSQALRATSSESRCVSHSFHAPVLLPLSEPAEEHNTNCHGFPCRYSGLRRGSLAHASRAAAPPERAPCRSDTHVDRTR